MGYVAGVCMGNLVSCSGSDGFTKLTGMQDIFSPASAAIPHATAAFSCVVAASVASDIAVAQL